MAAMTPPSMSRSVPVINLACSPSKKAAASAISSLVPVRWAAEASIRVPLLVYARFCRNTLFICFVCHLFVNADDSVLTATEANLFGMFNGVDAMTALDAFFH